MCHANDFIVAWLSESRLEISVVLVPQSVVHVVATSRRDIVPLSHMVCSRGILHVPCICLHSIAIMQENELCLAASDAFHVNLPHLFHIKRYLIALSVALL